MEILKAGNALYDKPLDDPITNETELKDRIYLAFGVRLSECSTDKRYQSPFRFFADAYFRKHSTLIALASRGFGGKTFLDALLGATIALTQKADVSILGGSGEQARRCYAYIEQWFNAERGLRAFLAGEPTQYNTRLKWGNTIQVLMASQTSVRGGHAPVLIADEIDEMKQDLLDAALGMPMRQNGIEPITILTSTRQNLGGTMEEMLKRADKNGWGKYEWTYKENLASNGGWLLDADVERKKLEVPKAMWDAEYENQEPNPEQRAITPSAVEWMFDSEYGDYEGREFEYIEIEPPEEGARYAHGIDWGQKTDFTVIVTLRCDTMPFRLVAFERCNRVAWDRMIGLTNERIKRYGGGGYHDGTGMGNVLTEMINPAIVPFVFTKASNSKLLSDYTAGIERGDIIAPLIRYMASEHRFASIDDLYGNGHLPDTMSAGAMAYASAIEGRRITWE